MTLFGSLQFGMEHNFLKSRPEKSASNYRLAVGARKNGATEAGRLCGLNYHIHALHSLINGVRKMAYLSLCKKVLTWFSDSQNFGKDSTLKKITRDKCYRFLIPNYIQ
jgi:hypothetical protein